MKITAPQLVALLSSCCVFLLSGCVAPECGVKKSSDPKYVVVEARVGATSGLAPNVEVTPTPTYEQARGKLRTIALRMPESCLNETAAQATGVGSTSKSIMGTMCGVWLAELERALINAGYRVISWNALVLLERQNKISTYQAARELGAEVVFMLNSLETNQITAGAQAKASYKYFAADPAGTKIGPQPLPQDERNQLRAMMDPRIGGGGAAGRITGLAATLDATAILVNNQESIWFYRHSVTRPLEQSAGRKFLFASFEPGKWQFARPPLPPVQQRTNDVSAEENESATISASAQDAYAAAQLELVRTVARDCVARFQKGGAQ